MTLPSDRISEPRAFLLVVCVLGLCSTFREFIAFMAKFFGSRVHNLRIFSAPGLTKYKQFFFLLRQRICMYKANKSVVVVVVVGAQRGQSVSTFYLF